jgi:hypothetical protein
LPQNLDAAMRWAAARSIFVEYFSIMPAPSNQLDPLLSLALALQNTKGGYALLLGSGISRAAGVPTGWEVVEDLVRRVAAADGEAAAKLVNDDPAGWYVSTYHEPPAYSTLLERLASTPTERRELLRRYFEPSAEERDQGLKVPTQAHRAIARLIRDGVVRVVLTTNFDQLLETALRDEGVTPAVVSTPDAVRGMMPLHLAPATIVKLHGDYLDTRIKNTPSELAEYGLAFDQLLDRVLDEYGMVVAGWSAEWDGALRSAFERAPNRRFTTFWAAHGEATAEANRIIEQRQARLIEIESADKFFDDVTEKVAALESMALPHPLSTAVAITTLKRYLPVPEQRIRLSDLVTGEVARCASRVLSLVNVVESPEPLSKVREKMTQLESATEVIIALMANGAYWGEDHHRAVWVDALEQIGNVGADIVRSPGPRYKTWAALLRYPGQLAFYAGGLAAVARGRAGEETLLDLILKPRLRLELNGGPTSPAWSLNSTEAIEPQLARRMPGWERHYTPISDHLSEVLRPILSPFLRDQETYDDAFDRFEYVVGLAYAGIRAGGGNGNFWAPAGRLSWRREHIYGRPNASDEIAAEIEREGGNWLLLRRGLFDGSVEKLATAREEFNGILSRYR